MSEDKVSWISAAGGAKPGPSAHGCCCRSRLERGSLGCLLPTGYGPGQDTTADILGQNAIFPLYSRDRVCRCVLHLGSELSRYRTLTWAMDRDHCHNPGKGYEQ